MNIVDRLWNGCPKLYKSILITRSQHIPLFVVPNADDFFWVALKDDKGLVDGLFSSWLVWKPKQTGCHLLKHSLQARRHFRRNSSLFCERLHFQSPKQWIVSFLRNSVNHCSLYLRRPDHCFRYKEGDFLSHFTESSVIVLDKISDSWSISLISNWSPIANLQLSMNVFHVYITEAWQYYLSCHHFQ